jgi:hypothetical protein
MATSKRFRTVKQRPWRWPSRISRLWKSMRTRLPRLERITINSERRMPVHSRLRSRRRLISLFSAFRRSVMKPNLRWKA